ELQEVHALTDVTGFGLLGHLLEIARGSGIAAAIEFDALPLLPTALELAQEGYATGASDRNWAGYGASVALPADFPGWKGKLLTDPQTSGGLLVACAPEAVPDVIRIFAEHGFCRATVIGRMVAGAPAVRVT
ncbi:MAG TPA: AIR synthase-related protein, partial [Burkholderiales bacterium]|nr:AIR synthase-related protein [Burkholderiales bacterium]